MSFTEITKNGKLKTELTDIICPAWRKYGKQPDPNKKDPTIASFFAGMSLIDGNLYISFNETGANKKYISFYIPQDSIETFVQRFGTFVSELAKDGKAGLPLMYKNREGVDVKLNLYAVVDSPMNDTKISYMKTTAEQGKDKIEFTCALSRQRSNFHDKGKDFFASIKAMSDALYSTFIGQGNGLYIDHLAQNKKRKSGDFKEEATSYSNESSSTGDADYSFSELD